MKRIFTLFMLFFSVCARVGAQIDIPADTLAGDPDTRISLLASEVEALQTRASGWDRFLTALPAISGYMQTGFEWSERSSSFFIKRIRLTLSGDIAPKLDYRLQIEFAVPRVVDAVLRYRPFEALNLQLGEFKIPFSIENTVYVPLKYEFIEYPLSLRRLMGFSDLCGLSSSGRDMGFMACGGLFRREGKEALLGYDIGVFNGEGINTRDRNRSKDLVARLTVRPVAGLQIASSGYWGAYGPESLERTRYGAGICYDRGPVVLRWEWICGTTGLPEGGGDLTSGGWYAVGGWRVTSDLLAVCRYDTFLENADVSATRQTNYTAGLLWVPLRRLRCQLNYTYEQYASSEVSNSHVVALMLTGIF